MNSPRTDRPYHSRSRLGKVTVVLSAWLAVTVLAGVARAEETTLDASTRPEESAVPRPLQPGWSVAAFGGYGTDIDIAGNSQRFDAFGLGVGARARYTAHFGLFGGVRMSHHFGEGAAAGSLSSALVELGWALPVGPLRAEPFASGGVTRTFDERSLCNAMTGECTPAGSAGYATTLGLGFSLVYPFADRYFAGATAETLLAVGPSFGLLGYATAGMAL